ncbi:hypothetical protein ACNFIC_21210 [Pseudomonas sp. NY15463]|uniref:hypothetical protein n=1 Tax=Pseudomonas sp. NY15463 TaxID=3400361 RepID=UPI003A8C5C55
MSEKEIGKEVLEAAIKLFGGDYVEAIVWLNKPCLALGNIKPIDAPAIDVLAVINRLNYGVAQ